MAIIEITYDAKCKHCEHILSTREGGRRVSACKRDGTPTRTHGSGWDTVRQDRKACDRFVMFGGKRDTPRPGSEHYCEDYAAGRKFCQFQCRHCSKNNKPDAGEGKGNEKGDN